MFLIELKDQIRCLYRHECFSMIYFFIHLITRVPIRQEYSLAHCLNLSHLTFAVREALEILFSKHVFENEPSKLNQDKNEDYEISFYDLLPQ